MHRKKNKKKLTSENMKVRISQIRLPEKINQGKNRIVKKYN